VSGSPRAITTLIGHSRLPLALLAIAVGLLLTVGLDPNVLCLVPALALALVLLTRRYPGERMLIEVRTRSCRHRARPSSDRAARPRVLVILARGGKLIASSLAVRPPPPAAHPAR
jgi:hypothetical protein